MELSRLPGVVTDQVPVVFPGVHLQREVALGIDDGGKARSALTVLPMFGFLVFITGQTLYRRNLFRVWTPIGDPSNRLFRFP